MTPEERVEAVLGLVERDNVYSRAFARVALLFGILSLGTAGTIYVNDEIHRFLGRLVQPREFAFAWIDVFVLSAVAMFGILARVARANGDAFPSRRTGMALRAIAPLVVIPFAVTAWFFGSGYLGAGELQLVITWIAFYGLVLLSTSFFAPSGITILGWAFLISALIVVTMTDRIDDWTGNVPTSAMGVTFGLYHIVYAALNWNRRTQLAEETALR